MTAEAFVAELDERNQALLRRLAPEATLKPEVEGDLTVANLLKVALKNEMEATEIAARWTVTTDDVHVKMAFARQAGDEARHYRLIGERLRRAGLRRARLRSRSPRGTARSSATSTASRPPSSGSPRDSSPARRSRW